MDNPNQEKLINLEGPQITTELAPQKRTHMTCPMRKGSQTLIRRTDEDDERIGNGVMGDRPRHGLLPRPQAHLPTLPQAPAPPHLRPPPPAPPLRPPVLFFFPIWLGDRCVMVEFFILLKI